MVWHNSFKCWCRSPSLTSCFLLSFIFKPLWSTSSQEKRLIPCQRSCIFPSKGERGSMLNGQTGPGENTQCDLWVIKNTAGFEMHFFSFLHLRSVALLLHFIGLSSWSHDWTGRWCDFSSWQPESCRLKCLQGRWAVNSFPSYGLLWFIPIVIFKSWRLLQVQGCKCSVILLTEDFAVGSTDSLVKRNENRVTQVLNSPMKQKCSSYCCSSNERLMP